MPTTEPATQTATSLLGLPGNAILVFGLVVIGLLLNLARKGPGRITMEWIFRLIALTLILTIGLFLVTNGTSKEGQTAMMGLLGTLAGYILAKEGHADPAAHNPSPSDKPKV